MTEQRLAEALPIKNLLLLQNKEDFIVMLATLSSTTLWDLRDDPDIKARLSEFQLGPLWKQGI